VLRQFVSLFPHKLDVRKEVQAQLDPLEKAFKARMQVRLGASSALRGLPFEPLVPRMLVPFGSVPSQNRGYIQGRKMRADCKAVCVFLAELVRRCHCTSTDSAHLALVLGSARLGAGCV